MSFSPRWGGPLPSLEAVLRSLLMWSPGTILDGAAFVENYQYVAKGAYTIKN